MAISGFSTSNYAWISSSVVNNLAPFSMWCWFNDSLANSTQKALLNFSRAANNTDFSGLEVINGTLRFAHNTTSGRVTSSNTYTTNTWNGAGGVFASSTLRVVYLNGVKNTNTGSSTPVNSFPQLSVGIRKGTTRSAPATGIIIGQCGVWNGILTDEDFASLLSGAQPSSVRPDLLMQDWPLIRGIIDTRSIAPTVAGTLTVSPHPRIYK